MNQNEFIITKEYQRFVEFCNACKKENYIGLCYGPAGVGKSMATYHFARWYEIKQELELRSQNLTDYTWPAIEMHNCDTIVYVPPVGNSSTATRFTIQDLADNFKKLVELSIFKNEEVPLRERLRQRVKLIIVDEADRLQPNSLEQIRDIYDRQYITIILIGMPGIEKRLIRFPQFYSRIGFAHVYKPLNQDEITFIIQNHLKKLNATIDQGIFSDQEAIATFARITQGNFRLINRLLKQTIRVMEIKDSHH